MRPQAGAVEDGFSDGGQSEPRYITSVPAVLRVIGELAKLYIPLFIVCYRDALPVLYMYR